IARNPERCAVSVTADSGTDGESDEGRSRKMSGSRRFGLHRQTGEYRSIDLALTRLALSLSRLFNLCPHHQPPLCNKNLRREIIWRHRYPVGPRWSQPTAASKFFWWTMTRAIW